MEQLNVEMVLEELHIMGDRSSDTSSRLAAPEKLPLSTATTKIRMAARRSIRSRHGSAHATPLAPTKGSSGQRPGVARGVVAGSRRCAGPTVVQVQGGSDEGHMRERLRKISDLPPRPRVVLLREQADIVAKRQQALEQGACLRVTVLQRVVIGEPKTAGEEGAFSRGQAVDLCVAPVAQHKAIDHELSLYRRDRGAYARIIRREEAHDRHQQ